CLRLIFRPGFSTATEVSDLSGRGIGLDVVDRAMEQAGGEVRVQTEPGKGTTFLISLPVALALVRCVLVRSGEQLYAIASARVAGQYSLDGDERRDNGNAGALDWKGQMLPLFSLARSEEHTSELQSLAYLVCRLLLRRPPDSTFFPYTTLFRSLISLPVALALVRCVLVRSGEQLYAIASARVAGQYSLDGDERRDNGNAGAFDWKGQMLPLFSLA